MGILKYRPTSLISYERGSPLACLDGRLIKPNQASHRGARWTSSVSMLKVPVLALIIETSSVWPWCRRLFQDICRGLDNYSWACLRLISHDLSHGVSLMVEKVRSKNAFSPSELSWLNASLIEHRSFNNERGHGFVSRVWPVMSFLHMLTKVYLSRVSDNWCHSWMVDYDLAVKLAWACVYSGRGEDGVGLILQYRYIHWILCNFLLVFSLLLDHSRSNVCWWPKLLLDLCVWKSLYRLGRKYRTIFIICKVGNALGAKCYLTLV
jgi:hypothetical protein